MQKSNVRMVVQGIDQTAAEFASELQNSTNLIIKLSKKKLIIPPVITCTAASDGRQTAMIQYFTNESKGKKESLSKSQSRINDFFILIIGEIERLDNEKLLADMTVDQEIINSTTRATLHNVKEIAIEILKPTV